MNCVRRLMKPTSEQDTLTTRLKSIETRAFQITAELWESLRTFWRYVVLWVSAAWFMARQSFLAWSLGRAKVQLAKAMLAAGVGDESVRRMIRDLDLEINTAKAEERPARFLRKDRHNHLQRLLEDVPDPTPIAVADEVQQINEIELEIARVNSRLGELGVLLPGSGIEWRRLAFGVLSCCVSLWVVFALGIAMMPSSSSNRGTAEAESKPGTSEETVDSPANRERLLTLLSRAREAARSVEGNLRADALIRVAGAQVMANDPNAAWSTCEEAQLAVQEIDYDFIGNTAKSDLIKLLVQLGRLDLAEETAESISKPSFRNTARATIVAGQARAGKLNERYLKTDDPREQAEILLALADANLARGDTNGAIKAVEEASTVCTALESDESLPKACMLLDAAELMANAKRQNSADKLMILALQSAKEISDADSRATTLANIGKAMMYHGKDAELVFRLAQDAVAEVDDKLANGARHVVLLCSIAGARAEGGDRAGSLATIDRARRESQRVNRPEFREVALGAIARALATAGDIEGALQIAESLSRQQASTFADIAAELVKAGKVNISHTFIDRAVESTHDMADDRLRAGILQKIAFLYARVGDVDGAFRVAENLLGEDAYFGARACVDIAEAFYSCRE